MLLVFGKGGVVAAGHTQSVFLVCLSVLLIRHTLSSVLHDAVHGHAALAAHSKMVMLRKRKAASSVAMQRGCRP